MYGFTGKILHINLTTHAITIEEPDEAFYRQYPGGSLLGLYYLWTHTPQGADPLGPDNTLTLACSAPTGLPVSGQSRATATCKSPSSGGVADAQAGGFWPAELKFAGFDAIVLHGASETPVYLWIQDGEAELRDASHLWGKTTLEVDEALKDELGDKRIEIAQIGPAGEKMANFAAIINMANRAWGRTGVGAVMGSKKLKAIAVRGTNKVTPADKKAVAALAKKGAELFPKRSASFGRYGTAGVVMGQQHSGGLPSYNWNQGVMDNPDEAEAISGERLYDELLRGAEAGKQDKQGRDTCYACVVRCKRVAESEWQGNAIIPEYGGPEYETLATFGSYCGVSDLHAVTYANQLCNEYGVDTISCGATIAWAMECFENGVLTLDETDGISLNFGTAEAMIAILKKTLARDGFGDVLANGSAKAADILGKGHEFLTTVKGQEMPAHMPHVKRSLGLIYGVNPFGADHESSEHDTMYHPKSYAARNKIGLDQIGLSDPQDPKAMNRAKVAFALKTQYLTSSKDVLGLCNFVFGSTWQLFQEPQDIADMLAAATGWAVSVDDIQRIGQRRVNLMRAFNTREGLTRADDTLPQKTFRKALKNGRSDGIILDKEEFETALDTYYDMAGWDVATGTPTPETLAAIDLAWVNAG